MGITEAEPCNCKASSNINSTSKSKGDNIFSPLKGKMKVLKKIKRRMGLASRSLSSGGGTNNLPPLLFHNVHGENIRISRDGIVAKRVESFCKGIVFSSRPVKVNEKVCVKFLEISNNWSGVIRFGFSYNDPSGLRNGLPKYACPDLTNKPGHWAKALPERYCTQGTILHYYVNSTGDVHFGINGEDKGIFFSGVDARGQLWALIDVYGNSTAIEFVDTRHQLNNSRCNINNGNLCNGDNNAIDRIVQPMQQMQIQPQAQREIAQQIVPALFYQPQHLQFNPMHLHRTKGRNVRFITSSRSIAYRTDTEFCQGYVFTPRPLQLGERVVVKILNTEPMYHGCLGLGLTSCDPATLQSSDLPDDSNFLLDRPEYWVISRDFARNLEKGDEISFCISPSGEVQISKNGAQPLVVMHVDQSLRLWAFFDIYGSTQKIRVFSAPSSMSPQRRIITPSTSESMNSLNSESELRRNSVIQANQRLFSEPPAAANAIRVDQTPNGRALLSVIINQNTVATVPVNPQYLSLNSVQNGPSKASHGSSSCAAQTPSPISPVPNSIIAPIPTTSNTGTMMSSCSSNYIEPISNSSSYTSPLSWAEQNGTTTLGAGAECTICYENPIDAVLYMCGHMCMCYECALQQWRGKGGGQCPLCRAVIKDVIRTYKS